MDGIGRKMLEVLDRYSRENGYTIVLDTSAQGSPVVYGSSQSDITQDIVRLYDQAYPVKTGSAAPAAAPAKPASATRRSGAGEEDDSLICSPTPAAHGREQVP